MEERIEVGSRILAAMLGQPMTVSKTVDSEGNTTLIYHKQGMAKLALDFTDEFLALAKAENVANIKR